MNSGEQSSFNHPHLKSILQTMDEQKSKPTNPLYEQLKAVDRNAPQEVPFCIIVAHCPKCNSPIYGRATIYRLDEAEVKRTCNCRFENNS